MQWPIPVAVAAMTWATPAAAAEPLAWVDLADLAIASPVVVRATVDGADRLSSRVAPDVPAGERRHLVEARLIAALRSPGLVPARAEWLWQGPAADAPRKRDDVLAFLIPAGEGPKPEIAQYRLAAAHGQLRWDAGVEAAVRAILADLAQWKTAPEVESVRSGFHAPGTIEGESESQIFVGLKGGTPITLTVLRRPGAAPETRVATGDLIDESAKPVARETLLWRALACGLPAATPAALAEDPALARDYKALKESLGPCGRRSAGVSAARSR